MLFFFSSRRRHTRYWRDWSSDVCSSDLLLVAALASGEYVIARLLGGTGWKTFALYQAEAQFTDGRVAAALAVLGFAFTWLVSMGLIVLSTRRGMASPIRSEERRVGKECR